MGARRERRMATNTKKLKISLQYCVP